MNNTRYWAALIAAAIIMIGIYLCINADQRDFRTETKTVVIENERD